MKTLITIAFMLVFGLYGQAQIKTIAEALSKNDTVLAMTLLNDGADINATDNNGGTALITACRWGEQGNVAFLVNHGVKIDEPRSPKGRTPLMVACAYYSGASICKLLIDKKADVNAADQNGVTSLMLAAQNAKVDVVKILLENGADASKVDNKGHNVMYYVNNATDLEQIKNSVKDCHIDKDATIAVLKSKM